MLKINGDAVRVLVSGICRAKIDTPISEDGFMSCTVHELPEKVDAQALTVEERASIRIMTDKFIEYAALTNQITDEIVDRTLADNEQIGRAHV